MLKTSLTLAALTLGTAVYAQKDASVGLHYPTQKGSILLGSDVLVSSLGYGNSGTDAGINYNLSINPRASYMLSDNLAAGVTLQGNIAGSTGFRSHSFGAGIFARYYFGKALNKDGTMRKLRFFGELGVNYGTGTAGFWTDVYEWDRYKFNYVTPTIMTGVSYFVTRNIAIEGGLYLSGTKYLNYGGQELLNRNKVGVRFGLQFNIGGKK